MMKMMTMSGKTMSVAAGLVALVVLAATLSHAAKLNYQNFGSTIGLNTVYAVKINGALLLSGQAQQRAGAAWFDAKIDVTKPFTTQFLLKMSQVSSHGADGLAFVIQEDSATALGKKASDLGYGGLTHALAIEFDTYQNADLGDPAANHISIHTTPNAAGDSPINPNEDNSIWRYELPAKQSLNSGSNLLVKIEYKQITGGTDMGFYVYLEDMNTPLKDTKTGADHVKYDLRTGLALSADSAWVGFTASTGGSVQNHYLKSWQLTTNNEADQCIPGFVAPKCTPDDSRSSSVCPQIDTCDQCTRSPYSCDWDDGCNVAHSTSAGIQAYTACPSPKSYTWVWILLAVAVVIIGTVITLWYFKRRASRNSLDSQYGYL
eukprot:TRINITY_DN68635_c0_g1_i1.p2 TRINITY_DN68635_c0_g1~~TRINITY_DN68635_c0_g1_i1.p2  ORF type:complete len:376 (+),score=202.39 TRINITY_DN68635_c0_g1_i1:104-1231(+)